MSVTTVVEPSTTTKVVEQVKEEEKQETPTLRLKLPKSDKKIQWQEGTVDNENMGKKSSKCCCVYKKPRMFGESSSEEDSDSENEDKCKGPKNYHKRSKNNKHKHDDCNACP